jgi:hypothetical protein
MSARVESVAIHVKRLEKASALFLILAWLVWAEFALGLGLGLTVFSEHVPHWSAFLVLFLAYGFLSACLFLASWTLKVVVYIFDELRLVV